jgi:hypothetical protein
MRLLLLSTVAGLLTLGTMTGSPGPAAANKTKMGCDSATEVWDATLGKCQPGTAKYKRGSAQPPAEVKTAAVKKAPAKKAPAKKAKGPDAAK